MAKGVKIDPELAKIKRGFEAAAKARKPFDIEWVLDCAFYGGKQYTGWDRTQQMFVNIPRPDHAKDTPRPIANKIYHFVMDTYASCIEDDPMVEVKPTNVDECEVSNAKVADAYCNNLALPTQANWQARRNAALFWVALCGEGWLKWTYSEKLGRPTMEACSPLEIYLPPNISSYLDARAIYHARTMDPEDIYEIYGVELEPGDLDPVNTAKDEVLREIGMSTGTRGATAVELWELPSRRHPEGRFRVYCGNRWLNDPSAEGFDGKFPYAHKQLPFTQIGHSPVPGTPHYTCGTRTMRPLNMELNQYHAQKTLSRKRMSNLKWFLDTQLANSMEQRPNDDPDQILVGDSRGGTIKPELIQAQAWSDNGDGEWIVTEMQDAVGLHDASTGGAPGRVDSAQGIDALKESDRARLAEVVNTRDAATARGWAQICALAKQYVSADQLAVTFSRDGTPQAHKFKTSQFPDSPLMHVTSSNGLPKNRAQRRAELIAMYTAGLFGDNPRPVLQMLDYPTDMNLTGEELDIIEAEAENMLMAEGIPITAKPWQNHELHRKIHDAYRKTSEFLSATDDVQGMFEHHMEDTATVELEEIQTEAERQARIAQVADEVQAKYAPAPDPAAAPTSPDAPPALAGATTPAPQPPGQAAPTPGGATP